GAVEDTFVGRATRVIPSIPFPAPGLPARPARLRNSEVETGTTTCDWASWSHDRRFSDVRKIRSNGRLTPSVNVAVATVIGQIRRSIISVINRRKRCGI